MDMLRYVFCMICNEVQVEMDSKIIYIAVEIWKPSLSMIIIIHIHNNRSDLRNTKTQSIVTTIALNDIFF